MGAHIDAAAGQEFGRSHLIEEDEGADHLPFGDGQGAADLDPAQVAAARHDEGFDGIQAAGVRAFGVCVGF